MVHYTIQSHTPRMKNKTDKKASINSTGNKYVCDNSTIFYIPRPVLDWVEKRTKNRKKIKKSYVWRAVPRFLTCPVKNTLPVHSIGQ